MNWIALKMLTGDRAKYLGIVFGVAFATLLMAQQSSIFCGLMLITTSQIRDIQGRDIWVMDPNVRFVDDIKPLSDDDLYRVRGVDGRRLGGAALQGAGPGRASDDGNFQQVILLGLDDATLVGAPREMRRSAPWPTCASPTRSSSTRPATATCGPASRSSSARTFEMNDHRAVLVGVCKASADVPDASRSSTRATARRRCSCRASGKLMSFVLAKPARTWTSEEVCRRHRSEQTGLKALTREQFFWMTIDVLPQAARASRSTSASRSLLGFVVGVAIAGQTFYLFTIENLKQFGALKAMGVSNLRIVGMILLQALVVGLDRLRPRRRRLAALFGVDHGDGGKTRAAGVLHAVARAGGHRRGGGGDRAPGEPAEHPPGAGAGAGDRVRY